MLQLECIGFRLHEVVGQVRQVMMIRAEEKGLALSMEVEADPLLVLLGDPFRLKQVLLNLVSNSIKFTEKGGVTITCQVRPTRPGRVEVMLSVTDTGIGMEPAFLQTIFENFTQNDKTTARRYGGTGLGMSICKQLVEMMGGCIEVKSQVNAGTTVTFRVPFSTGAEKDIPGREKPTANTSILRNCRVLLVEDNDINQLIASIILRKYGLQVTAVNNGKEAVEALAAASFDVVLMDMQMPVMDGLEATAYIRGHISKQVPIIALTANAIKGENERCINAGMNDYISKPFEEELLINTIAHWVKTEKTPAIPGGLYSLQKLEKMCGGDKHFLDKMVRLFLEQIPPAAAQIAAAYGNNDFAAIAFLAHRIKPTLDNMDIHSLYYGVRRIEVLAKEGRATPEFSQLVAQLQSVIEEVATSLSLPS
jgi:CheY-like chemotaxis protein/HPt (histidine-containing phosphotransfer) domain-containing protein